MISKFPNRKFIKSIWWMPRFYMAMKDAGGERYASGRCLTTFDPEISEWGNPAEQTSVTMHRKSASSAPREVKHLSTWRKRKQCKFICDIPLVAASEMGTAQTGLCLHEPGL